MPFSLLARYNNNPTAVEYLVFPLTLPMPFIAAGAPILAGHENFASAYSSSPDILAPPPVKTIPALIWF